MLKQTFVALGVATLVVLSTPFTASAAVPAGTCGGVLGTNYNNSRLVSVSSPVVAPGGTINVTWSPDFFESGSAVTITAGGNAGSSPVISTGSNFGPGPVVGTASGVGGLVVSVAVPADSSGRIDIAGTSSAACGGVSVTIVSNNQLPTLAVNGTVASNGGNTAATGGDASSLSGILAATGGSLPTVLLVSGSAAVVFGAILIGARTRARRSLQE